ncbi:MAG TPA: hypothetical protein VLC51_01210 [Nitrospira sp.]|nr:hypothetical protein [Nitrospira sp.]
MPDNDFTPALEEFHAIRLQRRSAEDQMRYVLEQIRDQAATKPNGGAWAAGVATLCLATLQR